MLGVGLHLLGATGLFAGPLQWPFGVAAIIASLMGTVSGLVIVFPHALNSLKRRSVDINILMLVAVLGACLLGDFAEAAAVVFFFCVGEALEERAMRKNRESVASLLDLTPQLVHVRAGDGSITDIGPDDVLLGATILVRPGERIALDGLVTEGSALVDEAPITGESVPVLKGPGDPLYAGTLSTDGRLIYATTATVENSTLTRIVRLVEQSQAQRTPYERFINRFARYYTPLVMLLAALVALVPTLLTLLTPLDLGSFATWGYRALALLVIACPCALVIATPICVVTGLARAARSGMLVKGGAFLELAAKVKAVAFDKTGTLTYGKPLVTESIPLLAATRRWGGDAQAQVLALGVALEQDSTHPLARAVVAAGMSAPTQTPVAPTVSNLREFAGQGVSAEIDGIFAAIGSSNHIAALVDYDAETLAHIERVERDAATALVVAFDGQAVGIIAVKDTVRPESAALLNVLNSRQRIHTVMLTGDNLITARAIAQDAGIEQVCAGLLPQDKMEYIERLRRQYGAVAMVGDGINDAPALAQADVGIAMGGAGSDTALEVADVVLMADNISELPSLFALARQVVRTIQVNIAFALTVKVAVMALAILGLVQMWMAIFADVGVLLIVILYSMRIGLTKHRGL
jgi:Cd2+/Zn2+-exporting ATPase